MTITLLAISLNEQPLSQPITAHFDGNGGTIGRADHNTMALPDPQRQISRLQAEIVPSGDGFLIRNLGSANPIVVGSRWLSQGEAAPLTHGDEVRIGGYLLHVEGGSAPGALQVTQGRARLAAAQPARPAGPSTPATWLSSAPTQLPGAAAAEADPFADLLGVAAPASTPAGVSAPAAAIAADPFADLFGPALSAAPASAPARPVPARADDPFAGLMPPPAGIPAASGSLAPRPSAGPTLLPDDFDPFAAPAPARAAPAAAQGLAAADPFASLQLAPAPPSIDQMFGLGQSQQDPLAHFLADSPAPGSGGPSEGGVSVDPLQALFGSDAAPPLHTDPVQGDQLSALNQPFQPPRVAPPAAPRPQPPGSVLAGRPPSAAPERPLTAFRTGPAPAAPAARPAAPQVPAGSGADAAALWAALCQGAGVEMALPPGPPEEAMRKVGRILRSAVDGTLALMTVRASTRHELRATVTVIQAKGNNPLKFSADGKVALERLLQPAMRGFLEGPGAMEDAMLDLMGHSIGTVAGMRAALDGMLDRFAPAELEAKLVGKTVFENMLPGMRKARLWDLYLQHHGSIREEAQEDFHTLFGKAFLAAYEQQINQLFREPKP